MLLLAYMQCGWCGAISEAGQAAKVEGPVGAADRAGRRQLPALQRLGGYALHALNSLQGAVVVFVMILTLSIIVLGEHGPLPLAPAAISACRCMPEGRCMHMCALGMTCTWGLAVHGVMGGAAAAVCGGVQPTHPPTHTLATAGHTPTHWRAADGCSTPPQP